MYLVRQIVSYRIRKYVVTVGQTLHQRGGAKTVCSVIGEVAFAYCVASFDRSHQFIVDPEAAHCVVYGRVYHHRRYVRVVVGNHLVHLEEVSVFFFHYFFTEVVNLLRGRVF